MMFLGDQAMMRHKWSFMIVCAIMAAVPVAAGEPDEVQLRPVPYVQGHGLAVAPLSGSTPYAAAGVCELFGDPSYSWTMPIVAGSFEGRSLRRSLDTPATLRPVMAEQDVRLTVFLGIPVHLFMEVRDEATDRVIASGETMTFALEAGDTWSATPELHFEDWTGKGLTMIVNLETTVACEVGSGAFLEDSSRFRLPLQQVPPKFRLEYYAGPAGMDEMAFGWKSPFGSELDTVEAVRFTADGQEIPVAWNVTRPGSLRVAPVHGEALPNGPISIDVDLILPSDVHVATSSEPLFHTDAGICFLGRCPPESHDAPGTSPLVILAGVFVVMAARRAAS